MTATLRLLGALAAALAVSACTTLPPAVPAAPVATATPPTPPPLAPATDVLPAAPAADMLPAAPPVMATQAPAAPASPIVAWAYDRAQAIDPMHPDTPFDFDAPAAHADLWQRMRQGFAMPALEGERVERHERWFASRPDFVDRMAERGGRFFFHFVEEAERRGLPLELALLPVIESALNPQAVSPVGAAGIWQFMPATGRHFELHQNLFRDDRRDVLASTQAALDYLSRLHHTFGDWHLALAAYNWGTGNVQRAIRRNRAAGLPTDFANLRMPAETRNYVPKLQAIENLIRDPQRLGIELPLIGNHPFFDSVTLERDIDVALVAELADVSIENFRQLNPAHDKPLIMAAGTPTILLPWDNALLFQQRLRAHQGPWATWTAWRVPEGMSVAQAAQRHDLSEARLRAVNDIPRRASQLRAGTTLLVPRQGSHNADVPAHIADGGQILLGRDDTRPASGAAPPTRQSRVTVRAGDTLSALARRHNVSVANLRSWNNLRPNATLRTGQVLLVQQRAPAASRAASAPARSSPATRAAAPRSAQQAAQRPTAAAAVRSAQAQANQSKVAVR